MAQQSNLGETEISGPRLKEFLREIEMKQTLAYRLSTFVFYLLGFIGVVVAITLAIGLAHLFAWI